MGRTFLLLLLVLGGCASNTSLSSTSFHGRYAWDGSGQDPNRPARRSRAIKPVVARPIDRDIEEEQARLNTLTKYSPEWWAAHDAIEIRQDAKLTEALVICRGCGVVTTSEEQTGSLR
jgi:hypothetical protein